MRVCAILHAIPAIRHYKSGGMLSVRTRTQQLALREIAMGAQPETAQHSFARLRPIPSVCPRRGARGVSFAQPAAPKPVIERVLRSGDVVPQNYGGSEMKYAGRRASVSRMAATAVLGLLLVVVSARDAAANCQNGSTSQSIAAGTTGDTLANIMAASTKPCTLTVAPGTYVASPGRSYAIADGITVRGTGAASATSLWVTPPHFATVIIAPVNGSCPSGATVEGLTIAGGAWGVLALADAAHPGCPSNQLSNVTLRNLIISTGPGQGHAIDFHAVQNSVIDSTYIDSAYANGIFLELGSNNNIVMNNTIVGSFTQHGIAVQGSNDNVIVGNTIRVSTSFDGIILNSAVGLDGPGSLRNRIERNAISGHKVDGIVMTDASHSNYVGLNVAVSDAYVPGSPPSRVAGVGIWVNNASNANYLYGNDLSGSPENGIDVLASKSTLLVGNTVHGNYHGGLWIAYVLAAASPSAPVPQDTVVHGNNVFYNYSRQLFFQTTVNSQAAFNYFSGTQYGVLASTGTVGFDLQDTLSATIFENTISEVWGRAIVHGSTNNTVAFRNRFLKGTNTPSPNTGLNGLTYSLAPADVRWDSWSFLGGNYWSEYGAAVDNPDLQHPYKGFITDSTPVDRFPFAAETLQTASIPNSVTVVEPAAGAVLAAQTRKTIRWVGRGCSYINLYYYSGATPPTLIATTPNTGYYIWTVPSVAFRSDYFIHAVCTNSNLTPLGAVGNSAAFTIAASDLVLMNPGRGSRATNGGTLRVAWKASAQVGGVNVFVKAGTGAETQVAFNVTGRNFTDITLPPSVSTSSAVTVRIQDSGNSSRQDSVDGHFMVRGASPAFLTNFSNTSVPVGSVQLLRWAGPSTAYTVDLDLIGPYATSIAKNLPDFGNFTWLVPDAPSASSKVRATFKDANGGIISVLDTVAFSVTRPGVPVPPVRNLSGARRDLDGDGKTELVVFRPSTGVWYVRYSSLAYSTSTIGAFAWGVAGDVPVSGDFDGDGRADVTVFRPSTGSWYILYSTRGYSAASYGAFQWGAAGDIPVAGDFDGDGRTELTVFRPSTGTWYVLYSSRSYNAGQPGVFAWGGNGDVPVAGDFDGDGRTELTVFRPSTGTWYVVYSSQGYNTATYLSGQWGLPGDIPLASDFDGDGVTDLAAFRPSNGGWFIRYSTLGYSLVNWGAFYWGQAGDVPLAAADFDGDGKAEISVFRPSTGQWFILQSTSGYSLGAAGSAQWGSAGDIVPK
jgi:parallel beta-helix repeat protein